MRNETSESWRISLSASCDTGCELIRPREGWRRVSGNDDGPGVRGRRRAAASASELVLGGDLRPLEMLVRRAVVALGKRRTLARLPLARGRLAAGDAAVEGACLDLLVDELHRCSHALLDRPADLRLVRDREVAADVLEQGPLRPREVVRVVGKALHRLLARKQDLAPVLELGVHARIRIDEILDGAVDRPGILIHAAPKMKGLLVHAQSHDLL